MSADERTIAQPWWAPAKVIDWFSPVVPRNRLAVLKVIAHLFAIYYVFHMQHLPEQHAHLAASLYQPLRVAQILHVIPRPTPLVVQLTRWGLLAAALVGLAGKLPRTTSLVVACCYFQWVVMASSYGKVDHDQLGFVLLLFALPTVGRLSLFDDTPDPHAGWVLRLAEIGAVATYFLSALAKLRFGGIGWVNSATIERAILRRGTPFGRQLGQHPLFIHVFQYVMFIGELCSPLLFVRRFTNKLVVVAFAFHVATYLCLTIGFWPHQVSLLAFLPLELLVVWFRRARQRGSDATPAAEPAEPLGATRR